MDYNGFSRQPNNHEEWKLVDQFNSAYWSGLDVQIYANNILLTEAIQVNYIVTEQVRPYYGYASYIPDRLYHGSRIIQGELSLNFKRDGYLFSLLDLLRNQREENVWLPTSPPSKEASNSMSEIRPPNPYTTNAWGPQSVSKIKGIIDPKVAKDLVDRKKAATNEATVNSRYEANVPSRAGMFETKTEGFDINIIFGANLNSGMTLRFLSDDSYIADGVDSGFADGAVLQTDANKQGIVASTGIKLIGISIMGLARSINDDGRPIIETYTFQARDVQILKNSDPAKPLDQARILPTDTGIIGEMIPVLDLHTIG